MTDFVVIEGLIGVGKTSLARLLQRRLSARLILEPADDNPFLNRFYADPERYAFPAQMFYLAARYAQQMDLAQDSLFPELVVSDYLYAKDRIFAEQTLEGAEMDLYDRFDRLLAGSAVPPRFVIFLDAPLPVILERISRRGIDSELRIEPRYLEQLRQRYFDLWSDWTDCPVYVVNTSELNYVDDPAVADRMVEMVRGWLAGRPHVDAPECYRPATPQETLFA